jgi:hypothetical protein
LERWHKSTFGSTLRFCDIRTYQLTRSIWEKYAKGALSEFDENMAINEWEKWQERSSSKEGFVMDPLAYFWPCGLQVFQIHVRIGESFRKSSMPPESIYHRKTP